MFVLPPCTVQAVNTIVLLVINLGADEVIAVLMGVIFLVGKQRRLETGAAAMQNAIARIEDLIDKNIRYERRINGRNALGVREVERWLRAGFDTRHQGQVQHKQHIALP